MPRLATRWSVVPLLLVLSGCLKVAGTPVGELAELLTMGHERQLQKPLRPIRGTTRVLIFALDGVGRDALYDAVRQGRMPHVARLLGAPQGAGLFAHAYGAPDALSIFPSTTTAAWTAVFTGRAPAHTAVPGNEWFARDEATFYAPVPVTIRNRSHAAKTFTDELLSRQVQGPTLYEQLPAVRMHVGTAPLFRGADLVSMPELAKLGDLFGAVVGETLAGSVKKSGRVARESDETTVGSLLQSIRHHGLPDVQTVYFNGIDLLTHYAERPLEDQRTYLESVTDTLVGKVLDAYREQGALERTYVVFVADHGHTPVLPDDRHALGAEGEDEPPAALQRAGFRMRPLQLTPDTHDYQAALAYQGFSAYVYLADRSTCPRPGQRCDWSRPPRLQEDVLPAARALWEASERGVGVPELRGTLDLILARPATGGGQVLAWDGERFVPLSEQLRRRPRPDLLRLEERIAGLLVGPYGHRAGDLVLLSRAGSERPIEERFYFGEPQHSEHGSASAQDSRIPLLVAHPGRTGALLRERVRAVVGDAPSQLHLASLVRALLDDR